MDDSADHTLNLPPALLEAPREFDAWSKARLLVEQTESTPIEPLYHYTGEASLRGILSRQHLWCFSHLHQRDPTEFEYALRVALRVINEMGQSDDFFTKHFCECLDDMLETNGLAGPFDFYLFSLSHHRDHARQWVEYGQDGHGYAIGFAPKLFQPDRNDLYEEANKNLHVGRVIYGDGDTSARHRMAIATAAEITSRIGSANIEHVRMANASNYLATMVRELLASQLIWNCLTAKDSKYAGEREVRGIILNVKAKFDSFRRSHGGRSYVEHEMPLKELGSISEILIGPRADPGAEQSLAQFLRDEGYEDVPIRRSLAVL